MIEAMLSSTTPQLVTAAALLFGEILIVGSEMYVARYFPESQNRTMLLMSVSVISFIGVLFLMYGYTYGYQAFKNIWVATALSVAGILVVEPILALVLFRQLPTLGAGIAFVLGVVGIILTVTVR